MVESLLLSGLPKWKHAGQSADSVVTTPAPDAIAEEEYRNKRKVHEERIRLRHKDLPEEEIQEKLEDLITKRVNEREDMLRQQNLNEDLIRSHLRQFRRKLIEESTYRIVMVNEGIIDGEHNNVPYKVISFQKPSIFKDPVTGVETEETVKTEYLVPHYMANDTETSDPDISYRDIGLLNSRVQKFFRFTATRDKPRTKEDIKAEIARLKPRFEHFKFDKSYRELTQDERALVTEAGIVVGHIVRRLATLGKIIIEGDRDNVWYEHPQEYIDTHMPEICKEFQDLWMTITATTEGMRMVDCVMTRHEYKDHDHVFSHLIREIGKPVLPHIPRKKVKVFEDDGKTRRPQADIDAEIERETELQIQGAELETRHNLVGDIGATMLAIDQVSVGMHVMMDHKRFKPFVQKVESAINHGLLKERPTHDLDVTNYRGYVREYIDLSKAITGIRTEEADVYDLIDSRLEFLSGEIKLCHAAMREMAQQNRDKVADLTIPLLERGLDLITEMSELRLPRNEKASGLDGNKSSVERYSDRVNDLLQGRLRGGGIADD